MEWIICGLIFVVLAKKGLAAQGKRVDVKGAASQIAANVTLEVAELLEVDIFLFLFLSLYSIINLYLATSKIDQ